MSAVIPASRQAKGLLPAALLLVALGIAYAPIWTVVINQWQGYRGFYSHGFVVLIMAAYLVWRQRDTLVNSRPASLWLALACAALGLLWMLAWATEVLAVQILAAYLVSLAAISYTLGQGGLLRFGLPMSIVVLALPIWAPLQPILQAIAAWVSGHWLALLGLPVHIEGEYIDTPAGLFLVAGGCSGLGYLLTNLSFVSFLILNFRFKLKLAVLFFLSATLFGVFANWLRITLIVLVGNYWSMDNWIMADHVTFGWFVYFFLLLPFIPWINRLINRAEAAEQAQQAEVVESTQPAAVPSPSTGFAIGGVATLGMLVVCVTMPTIASWLDNKLDQRQSVSFDLLGEHAVLQPATVWQPSARGADLERLGYVTVQQRRVFLYQADFYKQSDEGEVISRRNTVLGDNLRRIRGSQSVINLPGSDIQVRVQQAQSRGRVFLVWHWYRVGEQMAADSIRVKAYQAFYKITGRGDASILAMATECTSDDCDEAAEVLADAVSGRLNSGNLSSISYFPQAQPVHSS